MWISNLGKRLYWSNTETDREDKAQLQLFTGYGKKKQNKSDFV